MRLVWREEDDEWIADYNNVRAVVFQLEDGWYNWAVFSYDSIDSVYRPFIDGGVGRSLIDVKKAAERELTEFASCLQKVYDKADKGSLMRSNDGPHMVWTQTFLGKEGGDEMLTNDEVSKKVIFVKCPSCDGRHLLGVGREVPMYWCGHLLKRLGKEDKIEFGNGKG